MCAGVFGALEFLHRAAVHRVRRVCVVGVVHGVRAQMRTSLGRSCCVWRWAGGGRAGCGRRGAPEGVHVCAVSVRRRCAAASAGAGRQVARVQGLVRQRGSRARTHGPRADARSCDIGAGGVLACGRRARARLRRSRPGRDHVEVGARAGAGEADCGPRPPGGRLGWQARRGGRLGGCGD